MISVVGQVVGQSDAGTRIQTSSAGCLGCNAHCDGSQIVLLPGISSENRQSLKLSLGNFAFVRVVFNSLGLPLIGFVMGASIAHFLSGSDFVTFSGALTGLGLGALLCRRQTLDLIEIREAVNDG